MPIEIKVGRKHVALVSEEDYPVLSLFKWHAHTVRNLVYAGAWLKTYDGRKRRVDMHRVVLLGATGIDHRDQNTLNNQRSNLRTYSGAQNYWNRGPSKANRSGVKGVWLDNDGKWTSQIRFSGNRITLGTFSTFDDAVRARKYAELKHYGEFSPWYAARKELDAQ